MTRNQQIEAEAPELVQRVVRAQEGVCLCEQICGSQ